MSTFSRLAQELDEAIAAPMTVLGGPRPHHEAPNAGAVDLETTKDYSELLKADGVEASTEVAEEPIDVEAEEDVENETETNWASDALDEAAGLSDLSKVITSMLTAPSFERRVEALIKKSGVKDAEEVKGSARAFREAMLVHLVSVVPLAMRDVGIDVAGSRVNQARASLKRAANEERRHERGLDRLAEELQQELA